jgi:hypothetical protein
MIHMMRKLKCKFTGADDFLPEGIPRDKFLPVLGIESRKRIHVDTREGKQGKQKEVEDIFYLVTDDKGKLISIASFNCATMIDEKAEIDFNATMQMMNNITIIGKILSEKMAKNDNSTGS